VFAALSPVCCTLHRLQSGGFFKRHQDYLSLTSNAVEEYTLIMCVTPPEVEAATPAVGGETLVHVNPYFTLASKATTTRGGVLLFRKDLAHEGAPLVAGEKHIVTLNVWAYRKTSRQVLLVTFPPAGIDGAVTDGAATSAGGSGAGVSGEARAEAGAGGAALAAASAAAPAAPAVDAVSGRASAAPAVGPLQRLAASRSYALPAAAVLYDFPQTALADFLREGRVRDGTAAPPAERAARSEPGALACHAGCSSLSPVIEYRCSGFSYEQFAPVFRILAGMYVSATDATAAAACGILAHFRVPLASVLVDAASAVDADLPALIAALTAGPGQAAAPAAAPAPAATTADHPPPAAVPASAISVRVAAADGTSALVETSPPSAVAVSASAQTPAAAGSAASSSAAVSAAAAALHPLPLSAIARASATNGHLGLGGAACAHCGRAAEQLPPGALGLRQCKACRAAWYCPPPASCETDDAAVHALQCRQATHLASRGDVVSTFASSAPLSAATSAAGQPLSPHPPPAPAPPLPSDEAVILCTSEERMRVVGELARSLDLPYVPFTLVYAEGSLEFGGDAMDPGVGALEMEPVWASFGDYGAIYGVHRIRRMGTSDYAGVNTEIGAPGIEELVPDSDDREMLAVRNRAVTFLPCHAVQTPTFTPANNVVSFTGWGHHAARLGLSLSIDEAAASAAALPQTPKLSGVYAEAQSLPSGPLPAFHRSLLAHIMPLLVADNIGSPVPPYCVTYPDGAAVDSSLAELRRTVPVPAWLRAATAGAATSNGGGQQPGLLSRVLGALGSLFGAGGAAAATAGGIHTADGGSADLQPLLGTPTGAQSSGDEATAISVAAPASGSMRPSSSTNTAASVGAAAGVGGGASTQPLNAGTETVVVAHGGGLCAASLHEQPFAHITSHAPASPVTPTIAESVVASPEALDTATPALHGGVRMFHRNAEGKTCFSPAEAAAASAYIQRTRVLSEVRHRIRHMTFQLPQQASNISSNFCNESVYGRMNLVMVHGLLRLGDA